MSFLEEVMQERDRLRAERAAAVEMLRIECAEYDDNDWPSTLHLADIIEKHLARSAYEEIRIARERYVRLATTMRRLTEPGGWQTPEIINAIAKEALGE